MNKETKKIALKTAIRYYGFSKRTDRFPPNIKVNYYWGDDAKTNPSNDKFLSNLIALINSKWQDNIGSLSKTARMSLHDFAWYVNEMRKDKGMNTLNIKLPNEKETLVEWMRNIANMNDSVILVELKYNGKEKYLLVNTAITYNKTGG